MSNYPLGAENDPYAPFNEHEKVLSFEVLVQGKIYITYSGDKSDDEIYDICSDKIKALQENIKEDISIEGDLSVININSEIW